MSLGTVLVVVVCDAAVCGPSDSLDGWNAMLLQEGTQMLLLWDIRFLSPPLKQEHP